MSYNGSGVFVINSTGQPVSASTLIEAAVFNAFTSDVATGLSTAITKDGQTTPTANLPMATYRHTGVGAASATTDYARYDQVQNSASQVLSSVSGADTITANATPTPAAYAAGQTFRFVSTGANTGAVTLNVSSLGAKAITKNGTTALVAGDIPSGAMVEVAYDGTRFQLGMVGLKAGDIGVTVQAYAAAASQGEMEAGTEAALRSMSPLRVAQAITALATSGLPRSYLAGYGLSNNVGDATNDIDIAVGSARDSTNAADITLASALTKQLDAAWAVGTNQGGLDTGSIANATYHIWAIKRSDTGVVDALFSTSATAPTMPANYDYKRRIGSIVRTGAAIKAFTQDGDLFQWLDPVLDADITISVATAVLTTLTVPAGINVFSRLNISYRDGNSQSATYLSDPAVTDSACSVSAAPLGSAGSVAAAVAVEGLSTCEVRTNTSSQIRRRSAFTGGSTAFIRIATTGWIDARGRNA